VEAYAREWGSLQLDGLRLRSAQGVVARLTRTGRFTQRLTQAARQGEVRAHGSTIVRCERDDEWYERAGYRGDATHHHLVLPEFEVTAPLSTRSAHHETATPSR